MTVSSETYRVIARGNGNAFDFQFPDMEVFESDQLTVIHRTEAGVVTVITEGTTSADYSVTTTFSTAARKSPGFITFPADEGTAMPVGDLIFMIRNMDLRQGRTMTGLGDRFPNNIEKALDKLVYQVQELQEALDRAPKLPVQHTLPDVNAAQVPAAAAFKTFRWDTDAQILEAVEVALSAEIKEDITDLTDTPSTLVGAGGKFMRVNDDEDGVEFVEYGAGSNVLHVRDVKASDAGGTPATATWTTRVLNTVKLNTITDASLATNLITLPIGDYEVYASCGFYRTERCAMRLRDTTASATVAVSQSGFAEDSNTVALDEITCFLMGAFTLTAESDLALQYWAAKDTGSTSGLGVQIAYDGEERWFAEIFIRKVG